MRFSASFHSSTQSQTLYFRKHGTRQYLFLNAQNALYLSNFYLTSHCNFLFSWRRERGRRSGNLLKYLAFLSDGFSKQRQEGKESLQRIYILRIFSKYNYDFQFLLQRKQWKCFYVNSWILIMFYMEMEFIKNILYRYNIII